MSEFQSGTGPTPDYDGMDESDRQYEIHQDRLADEAEMLERLGTDDDPLAWYFKVQDREGAS